MSNNNEEIDLGPLVNSFVKGTRKFFAKISVFIQYGFRIKWKLLAFGLAFSLVGLALTFIIPKEYKSTFTAFSGGISNEFHREKINDLDFLIEEDNFSLLSEKLVLPIDVIEKINEIRYIEIKEYPIDSINLNFFFKVEVKVSDNSLFEILQPQIVSYLSDVDFYQRQMGVRRDRYNQLIKKLDTDIQELDSLRLVVANNQLPKGQAGGFVFGEPLNPIDMYQEGYKLFNEQLQLKASLENLVMIQVAKDFTVFRKPSFPKKSIFMSISFALGVLIGMIKYSKS